MDSLTLKKNIGENIEQLRLRKKKTVKEMASLLNLTHTGYRNIERGKTELTLTKIFQIILILNVSLSQIFDLETMQFLSEDRNTSTQIIETLRSTIQHHKEEISFLRKQLEIVSHYL